MNLTTVFIAINFLLVAVSGTSADDQDADPGFVHLQADEVEFRPVPEVPGLQFAVLAGDPGDSGPYVIRAKFGPGLRTPPHYHDQDRFVSVVSGVWAFGTGDSGDCGETIPLRAGAFAMHPKGAVHYDGSCNDAEVVVQITGIGPVDTYWLDSGE